LGRMIILAGVALVCLGLVVSFLSKTNLPLGRLPGDLVYRGKNTTVYFPWVTCLVISVLLSLLFWLFNRR
jgi:hypothetical protein